jgi:hypothetical protein
MRRSVFGPTTLALLCKGRGSPSATMRFSGGSGGPSNPVPPGPPRSSSSNSSIVGRSNPLQPPLRFGPLALGPDRELCGTERSVALQLNPCLPGHCVVAPRHQVCRDGELNAQNVDPTVLFKLLATMHDRCVAPGLGEMRCSTFPRATLTPHLFTISAHRYKML